MVKQPPEVAAIRHAIDITVDTMIETFVPDRLQQFGHEYELEAALTQGFRSRGARGHAFDPIVAGGKHAATIHNLKNDAPLKAHELIVVDVGAEASHYDADITRTVAFGTPTSRQQAVYDAVLEVQKLAFGRLKPGLTIKESEQQVEQDMGVVLKQLGLITGNDRASIRTYYPHACSHSLGLDPHDAADYSLPLAPGMVITVEPGIYIPEEGIGVRLEDDVLVTDSGIAILSDRLPRTLF
jgi:Xaa-Pro aminopeptidase